MKIRNGFVSNSSSSSFVLIGKTLTKKSEIKEYLETKKYPIYALGEWFEDGRDVFELDEEMFDCILTKDLSYNFEFMLVYKDVCDYDKFDKNDLPDGIIEIKSGEMDMHSTSSVEELKEYYNSRGW